MAAAQQWQEQQWHSWQWKKPQRKNSIAAPATTTPKPKQGAKYFKKPTVTWKEEAEVIEIVCEDRLGCYQAKATEPRKNQIQVEDFNI